jgi:hypothetical protein
MDAPDVRPVFQGDVFEDVPFVKAMAGNRSADPPRVRIERRYVAALLHPCDMYGTPGRSLNRVQVVAIVKKADMTVPENWGGAWSVCPLPDLFGDGEMWVIDLNRLANIDRTYLTKENRVRCLSETGWAVFRQRLANAGTRGVPRLEDLIAVGETTWQETQLETEWLSAGRTASSFEEWLEEPDPNLAGLGRLKALERGMVEGVKSSLQAALAT